ncbi:MAG: hypothetical protein ACXU8N_12535 [Telluria sp.]
MNTTSDPVRPPRSGPDCGSGIHFDGRDYCYREYRYAHLCDAQDYARLQRERPEGRMPRAAAARPAWHAPTPGEEVVMLQLGIAFDGRDYRLGPYRYEHFRDAARYALAHRPAAAPAAPAAPMSARQAHREDLLDAALANTFPASDPVASFTPA